MHTTHTGILAPICDRSLLVPVAVAAGGDSFGSARPVVRVISAAAMEAIVMVASMGR